MEDLKCFICGRGPFFAGTLEDHINQCLDQQQLEEDKKLAESFQVSSFAIPPPTTLRVGPPKTAEIPPAIIPQHKPASPYADVPTLLNPAFRESIRQNLPERYQESTWTQLYNSKVDGYSLHTFYIRVKRSHPTVIIIRDSNNYIFGGYASDAWVCKTGYFGTGESFLFRLHPDVSIYKWTKLNDMYMLAIEDAIGFGGGESTNIGLWIDGELHRGTSKTCETYMNEPLSSSTDFECHHFEAWSIGKPYQ